MTIPDKMILFSGNHIYIPDCSNIIDVVFWWIVTSWQFVFFVWCYIVFLITSWEKPPFFTIAPAKVCCCLWVANPGEADPCFYLLFIFQAASLFNFFSSRLTPRRNPFSAFTIAPATTKVNCCFWSFFWVATQEKPTLITLIVLFFHIARNCGLVFWKQQQQWWYFTANLLTFDCFNFFQQWCCTTPSSHSLFYF